MTRKKPNTKPAKTDSVEHVFPGEKADVEGQIRFFEECLSEVFEERRGFFLKGVQQRFRELVSNAAPEPPAEANQWTGVDSLSKLRSVVGGRFTNLKMRWLAAGFPLKESKGGELPEYQLEEGGWKELSQWIATQGYEVRLPHGSNESLFEIRSRK